MNYQNSRNWTIIGGILSIVAAASWATHLMFAFMGRLNDSEANNTDPVVLGICRVGFLAGLFGFYLLGNRGRLSSVGLGIAAFGSALHLIAAIIGVIADGWTYEPFADQARAPWYVMPNFVGHGLSLVGSMLMGIAALRERVLPIWKAMVPVLIGVSFLILVSFVPFTTAFLIWSSLWVVLGLAVITEQLKSAQQTTVAA